MIAAPEQGDAADRDSVPFMQDLSLAALNARRLIPGVRHASHEQDSSGLNNVAQRSKDKVECFQLRAV